MAAKAKKSGRKIGRIVLFGIELAIIVVMLVALYFVMSHTSEGPKVAELNPEDLEIHVEVQQQAAEGGTMHGYMNIALFGLDADRESQLYKGSRSDSTMIASVNLETGDIKLVSVYRDTYLNLGIDAEGNPKDYFWKCNAAYSYGGAEQAVKMLNMNLDMDITDFVAVGYKGLRDVIDGLGGVYINVENEEIRDHINNYQIGISEVLKCDYIPVKEAGYQLLDGMQATAYCRIRYGGGDDYKRTARQREVLKAIETKAKETDLVTLTKVFNDCIGDIYTSLDSKAILDMLADISNYRIADEDGFPQEDLRTVANVGAKASCVIPLDLEKNVMWLHQFLFDDNDYVVTDNVLRYGERIEEDTSKYVTP